MSKTICKLYTRGTPSIEWYDENNKPQYYCEGWVDSSTEEPIKECVACPDFVRGEQLEKDFKEYQKRMGLIK